MKMRLLAFLLLSLGVVAPAWSATCSVSEFSTLVTDFGGQKIQIALFTSPTPTTQTLTATTPTAVSNAFSSGTRYLWVYCDEVMHMQLGTDPATGLTVGDFRLPSGGFWIGLPPTLVQAGTLKIAFCDADCL